MQTNELGYITSFTQEETLMRDAHFRIKVLTEEIARLESEVVKWQSIRRDLMINRVELYLMPHEN